MPDISDILFRLLPLIGAMALVVVVMIVVQSRRKPSAPAETAPETRAMPRIQVPSDAPAPTRASLRNSRAEADTAAPAAAVFVAGAYDTPSSHSSSSSDSSSSSSDGGGGGD